MSALMSLIDIDQAVFYLINRDGANALFDWFFPMWRNKLFWIPVYFFIISFMVLNFKGKGYWFVLFLLLTVGMSDLASSHLIKKSVQRLRPCREPMMTEERVLVRCGSGYSFTSSHAANHFAISMFLIFTLGKRYRRLVPLLFFWAASIAFGQVYVGVHYPLDIICGAILGTLIATFGSWLYFKSGPKVIPWAQTVA